MSATTLSDAAKECSDNSNCHMFFDELGQGNSFMACEKTASSDESSYNPILYLRQGNKSYTQF